MQSGVHLDSSNCTLLPHVTYVNFLKTLGKCIQLLHYDLLQKLIADIEAVECYCI